MKTHRSMANGWRGYFLLWIAALFIIAGTACAPGGPSGGGGQPGGMQPNGNNGNDNGNANDNGNGGSNDNANNNGNGNDNGNDNSNGGGDNANSEVAIGDIGDRDVDLGSTLRFAVTADELDADSVRYAMAPLPLPDGATLNASTGAFSFRPDESQVGEFAVTFSATDTAGESASEMVTIRVIAPPADGVTTLAGQLLDAGDAVNGIETPIEGVTVRHLSSGASTTSNADGSFELADVPAGDDAYEFDGSTAASSSGTAYVGYRAIIHLSANARTNIDRPIYLVEIDSAGQTQVAPDATTVVQNPNIGVSLTMPPNTVLEDDGAPYVGMISVSQVPVGYTPGSLPTTLQPSQVITIQPMGLTFAQPAPVTFPNNEGLAPFSELDLWSLDHNTGEFFVSGTGQVSGDGSQIVTIDGGITAASWHLFLPGAPFVDGSGNNEDNQSCNCPPRHTVESGSATSVGSGNLDVRHTLVSYQSLNQPHSLTIVYQSLNADPRPLITSNTTIPAGTAVPDLVASSLEVGGVDQGTQVFTNAAGLSAGDTVRQVVQFGAGDVATGAYPYRLTQTNVYPLSAISSVLSGRVLVNNQQQSPYGAGWEIDGIARLAPQSGGGMLLLEGDGTARFLAPGFGPGTPVFTDDFESGTPSDGWSVTTSDTPVDAMTATTSEGDRTYIGQFGNDTLTLSLTDLPEHLGVTVRCDLLLINSWDGNGTTFGPDTWGIDAGDYVFNATFSNLEEQGSGQSYPSQAGAADNPAGTGAAEIDTLGTGGFGDSVYNLAFTFSHVDELLTVDFSAIGLQDLADESWGLDNVVVEIHTDVTGVSAPDGDASTYAIAEDGSVTRTLHDGTQVQFDATGLQSSITDRNGNSFTYEYDGERLTSITDPVGRTTELTYDDGMLATVVDPVGRTTRFEHDSAGNLTRIEDPDGTARTFDYDNRHLLISQTSQRGFETVYAYDAAGRHVATTYADESTSQFAPAETVGLIDPASGVGTRDNPAAVVLPSDVLATVTDELGNSTTYTTNKFGSATLIVDPLGATTELVYDAAGNPSRITYSNGAITRMTYDRAGNLLSSTRGLDSGFEQTSTFAYAGSFNLVTSAIDAEGNVATFAYDAAGNLTTITDALGGAVTRTYDARGLLTSQTDQNGNTTTSTHDAFGNVISVTDALGTITSFERDDAGNVTRIVQADGSDDARITTIQYDDMNRIIAQTDALGALTTFSYDEAGNLITARPPAGAERTITYDQRERVATINDPRNGFSRFARDDAGNVTAVTNGNNQVTQYEYDALGRVTRRMLNDGAVTQFAYDPMGNRTTVVDAAGNMTTYEYDLLNRVIRRTNALDESTAWVYDRLDRVISATDGRGVTTTTSYDAASHITEIAASGNTVTMTHDAVGNLLTLDDDDCSITYTYDAVNRRTTTTYADVGVLPAVTLTHTYNDLNQQSRLDDSEGGQTRYAYDAAGRMTNVVTAQGFSIDLSYNANGELTRVEHPNDVVTTNSLNQAGLVESQQHFFAAGATLLGLNFSRDLIGQVTTIVEGSQARVFEYDDANQIIVGGFDGVEMYDYDDVGNRISSHLSTTYGYDAANRLIEESDFTYGYDAAGNLTIKRSKIVVADTTYTYDGFNQLTRVEFPDGTEATYRYDGIGRRIETNVNGQMRRYVYDGPDIVLEYNGDNNLLARYSHGPNIDQPLAMERDNQTYFYHADPLGSIVLITDEAGAVVNSYAYDAFGRRETATEGIENPFQYTGREFDAETGLYYYRARYYDPEAGRFTRSDPFGFLAGDVNLYRYVLNSPINANDPLGLVVSGPTTKTGERFIKVAGVFRAVRGSLTLAQSLLVGGLGLAEPTPAGEAAAVGLAVLGSNAVVSGYMQATTGMKDPSPVAIAVGFAFPCGGSRDTAHAVTDFALTAGSVALNPVINGPLVLVEKGFEVTACFF